MPDGDTAEVEGQGNAPLDDTAPPLDEAPENAGVEGEPESASTADTPETVDPLASLDDDSIRSNPRIAALLEATAKDVEARKEESARRQVEAERARLRREAGESSRIQGMVAQLRDRLRDEDDAETPQTVAMFLKANADYEADRIARAAATAAAKNHGWDEATLKSTLELIDRLKGDELDELADALHQNSVKAEAERIAAAKIAEAEKRFQRDYEKKLEAAKKAAAIEAQPRRDAPPTASGGGAATGRPTLAQYASATYEQRQEWRKQGVEPVLA